ncbi:glycoside hydrolase superfamily [Auriculariales sp. MPI-PUGE-AT-0066]|nr:glycoside hydrolase superfamily [Auriculariales sp. MPI-PUGE-AT-0066]
MPKNHLLFVKRVLRLPHVALDHYRCHLRSILAYCKTRPLLMRYKEHPWHVVVLACTLCIFPRMKSTTVLSLLIAPTIVYAALDANIKAKGKVYFGTALDPGTINDGAVSAVAKSEMGQLTPENSAKWETIEPSQGSFSYGQFDTLMNFAKTNNKIVRGHTLVWHSQLPQWVKNINSASTLTSVIQNHVTTIMTRYKGQIYAWDVVNEVIDDSSGGLRDSVFSRLLNETFIDIAFKAARAADPTAKLYINDYNIDYAGTKLTAMLGLLSRLKSRGVPVDGVGTQAHLIAGQVSAFTSATQQLHNTGLDVAITELDIRISKPVTSTSLTQQQADYNTVTKACMNLPRCVGITVWGVSDKNSWVDSTFPSYDSPLLWDDNVQKKAAYTGAEQAIAAGPASSTTTSTTSDTTSTTSTTDTTTTTSPTTSTTTTTTTTSNPGGCTVSKWGQCGGQTYSGCTVCASGSTCQYSNPWYSQCL